MESQVLNLAGLTGLVELVRNASEQEKMIIVIEGYDKVKLYLLETKVIKLLAVVSLEEEPFPFNRYLFKEQLLIGLQTKFVETPELEKLIKELKKSNPVTVRDEIIRLQPHRTFVDVPQPEIKFLLTNTGDEEIQRFALYDASTAAWKRKAIREIHAYFRDEFPIVENETPVMILT